MICVKCGNKLEEGEIFCPVCGTKAAAEIKDPMYGMACTQNDRQTVSTSAEYKAPAQSGSTAALYSEPANTAAAAKSAVREKEFFGKGAFILCLIVIGILAASTGAFAYMYFSLLAAL